MGRRNIQKLDLSTASWRSKRIVWFIICKMDFQSTSVCCESTIFFHIKVYIYMIMMHKSQSIYMYDTDAYALPATRKPFASIEHFRSTKPFLRWLPTVIMFQFTYCLKVYYIFFVNVVVLKLSHHITMMLSIFKDENFPWFISSPWQYGVMNMSYFLWSLHNLLIFLRWIFLIFFLTTFGWWRNNMINFETNCKGRFWDIHE